MIQRMNSILFAVLMLSFASTTVLPAQTTGEADTDIAVTATLGLLMIVVAVLMYIIGVMDANVDPLVDTMITVRNYVIPQASEAAPDMGHDFDGIHELDNRIPPWFNYLFGVTIVFAIVYMIDYHVLNVSPLSHEEYTQEMTAAAIEHQLMLANEPPLDESKLVALTDSVSLHAGDETFHKFCISCHGPQGGGIVGPNLTDKYWIHGGGISNVYQTIKNGVPAKGMISWGLVFSQRQIQQIASYVLSLQGTNPPGAKAPQGDMWVEPKISSAASDSSTAIRGKKAL